MSAPKHLAIIPDGNRRWARARGLEPAEGHRVGFLETSPTVVEAAFAAGVHTVTHWYFSTENWGRSDAEVAALMDLYQQVVREQLPLWQRWGARVCWLGRRDRVPDGLRDALLDAEARTAGNTDRVYNIALDHGGRDSIGRAVRAALAAGVAPEELDGELHRFLDTAGQPHPEPDLILRTSGEQRLSGLLLWQSPYAELCFVEACFPALTAEEVQAAVAWYAGRARRWGA